MLETRWASLGVWATLGVALLSTLAHAATLEERIREAGNAFDDAQRLDILKDLRDDPSLNATRKAELDRLIAEIDRWLHDPRLDYFGKQVLDTGDYDFGISEDSPFHPLTLIYRARMLTWVTLEHGGYWSNPARRRERLDATRAVLEEALRAFPDNRLLRMYVGEPVPPETELEPVAEAPQWAALQREGLERLADIVTWWIYRRMQPNGEFGGGWGDDCEMWRWWVPVLIAFDDPKIVDAQARFSEALMRQEHMKQGYTDRVHDVEHTAEDSADAVTPMMLLKPDDETWRGRALRLVDLTEKLWTGTNDRGQLQFKSTYFSVSEVDLAPNRACDTVYHPRALQPALLYWQRTGDERLGRLFRAWMDTWVDATARSERGKPAGIVPSAIHWPDGNIGGLGQHWWDPENHDSDPLYVWPSAMGLMAHSLLLTHHMTGDPKYLEPLRGMAAARLRYVKDPPVSDPEPGTEAWCASKLGLLSPVLAKYRLLTGNPEFDELLSREDVPYLAYRLRGDRETLRAALRRNADALRVNFAGYTSEVRYTDRVLRFPSLFGDNGMFPEAVERIASPDPALLYATATGDPGDAGYFPLNAVRWLTPPRAIAALVTESDRNRFCAELFHFGPEPRPMAAELYLLEPGAYRAVLSATTDDTPRQLSETTVQVIGPRTRLPFELPPRQLCTLQIFPATAARQ